MVNYIVLTMLIHCRSSSLFLFILKIMRTIGYTLFDHTTDMWPLNFMLSLYRPTAVVYRKT